MYYLKKDYKLLGYRKSNQKDKMYYALLENKENKKLVRVHFGHNKYQNYRDLTHLNEYPHLIHNDLQRRKNYRARAIGKVNNDYYSPSWFSYYILW